MIRQIRGIRELLHQRQVFIGHIQFKVIQRGFFYFAFVQLVFFTGDLVELGIKFIKKGLVQRIDSNVGVFPGQTDFIGRFTRLPRWRFFPQITLVELQTQFFFDLIGLCFCVREFIKIHLELRGHIPLTGLPGLRSFFGSRLFFCGLKFNTRQVVFDQIILAFFFRAVRSRSFRFFKLIQIKV